LRITHQPPTSLDFKSNREKGRAPTPTEVADPWEYGRISVFDSFERAATKAVDLNGRLGWYITRIRLPDGTGALGRCSPRTGHCTISAPPGHDAAPFFWLFRMDARAVPR
jgi:hypothetical protein